MPKVTFLPMNLTFEVKRGESILDVAIEHNIPLQHACGGFCACTTCHVLLKTDSSGFSKMEDEELERLERMGIAEDHSRLGCQTKVLADGVVQIVNFDDH